MDFGLVDTLVSSATSASNNGGTSFSDPDNDVSNKQRGLYGFGFMKQERAANGNDEDFRDLSKISRMRSGSADAGHQQMLCFSSPSPVSQQYNYHQASYGFGSNSGGLRGPFTPSQWMELEHQALIYKYITANVPIPSYLLHPIRKAFESVGFSTFAGLRSNALGWGAFHLGFSSTDPEPGRCRRTDGKKWRCSRDAVVDQKYCERHMNRGRHRSRKPVEGQSGPPATKTTTSTGGKPTTNAAVVVPSHHPSGIPNIKQSVAEKDNNAATSNPSFGLVCSDSLLNPLNRSSSLRQFMDEWPENELDKTQLSISISSDEKLEMGLGVGPAAKRTNHRQVEEGNWVPISWEPSMGGPLGEALHAGGECNSTKPLNLIGTWESNSPRLASSPTGVLQKGPFGSLSSSSAGSSPRAGLCNGLIGSSLMNPSLPSL